LLSGTFYDVVRTNLKNFMDIILNGILSGQQSAAHDWPSEIRNSGPLWQTILFEKQSLDVRIYFSGQDAVLSLMVSRFSRKCSRGYFRSVDQVFNVNMQSSHIL
jgi:hypothetical protein